MHKGRIVPERYRLVSESSSYLYFREKTCKSGNDNNRKSKSYYNEIMATVDVKNQIVLVVDRQYDSTEKTAAVKAGVINTLSGQKVITFPRCDLLISFR